MKKEEVLISNENQEGKIYKGLDADSFRKHLEDTGFSEYIAAFDLVLNIAKAVKGAGGRALLVGGSVRDELLGLPVKDFDLEVYGLKSEDVKKLVLSFGKFNEVGAAFEILKLRRGDIDIDISLPRRESKTGKRHGDFSVSADPHMSIKEAARRRDFTFNSIAKDIVTGEIYDYFGGVKDLRNRILRATDEERFKDDPLRVLRAVQFVGRFGFAVEDKSAEIIRDTRSELKYLSKERFREEWLKLFLRSPKPSLGLSAAMEFGIFHEMHKDIVPPLASTPQEPEWHPEGDVWIHTLMVVDEAKKIVDREGLKDEEAIIVMLGAFCHDFGKPSTTEEIEGRIRSRGHEEAGVPPAGEFLSQIGVEPSLQAPIKKIVKEHLKPSELYRQEVIKGEMVSDGAIRKLAQRIYPATIAELIWVAEADHKGRGVYVDPKEPEKYLTTEGYPEGKWLLERARKLEIEKSKPKSIIMGRDLISMGLKPGVEIGKIIKTADTLRDEKGWTRERILAVIYDNMEKGTQEIIEILGQELAK